MIDPATFRFLRQLKKNNNREWLQQHRDAYESAKENMIAFAGTLVKGISAFDPEIAKAGLDPKQCLSRLARDIRFSKDKTPYKTHFFASVSRGGRLGRFAGYYIHIEPDACFAGGGLYQPQPADLQRVRQEIDYDGDEWNAILKAAPFRKAFPKGIASSGVLSRPPKGFDEENPQIGMLKRKDFYAIGDVAESLASGKTSIKAFLAPLKAIAPAVAFLNRALE